MDSSVSLSHRLGKYIRPEDAEDKGASISTLVCTRFIEVDGKVIKCENIAARVDMRTQECYCEECWKGRKKGGRS